MTGSDDLDTTALNLAHSAYHARRTGNHALENSATIIRAYQFAVDAALTHKDHDAVVTSYPTLDEILDYLESLD